LTTASAGSDGALGGKLLLDDISSYEVSLAKTQTAEEISAAAGDADFESAGTSNITGLPPNGSPATVKSINGVSNNSDNKGTITIKGRAGTPSSISATATWQAGS
jgi:hypothetical protein